MEKYDDEMKWILADEGKKFSHQNWTHWGRMWEMNLVPQ